VSAEAAIGDSMDRRPALQCFDHDPI